MFTRRSFQHQRSRAPRLHAALLLPAVLAVLALALNASSASASGPATVTVRVLGSAPGYPTLVPLTTVTTNDTPVFGENSSENTCSGTSALGALQLATAGKWSGKWEENEYFVEGIHGTTLTNPYYWSFWLNNKYAEEGSCKAQLSTGEQVLFFPECFSTKGECPAVPPPNILAIEVPPTVEVKAPVPVTVVSYPNAGGEPTPAANVNLSGGEAAVTTDAEGHATLTFGFDTTYILRASSPPETPEAEIAVPAEAIVCAHEGEDGTCGTKSPTRIGGIEPPASSQLGGSEGSKPSLGKAQSGIVASATGLVEGHRYSRKHSPRTLSGIVFTTSSITSLSIRLRRTWKGRCYVYNGLHARLQHVPCSKQASFFKIEHKGSSFSYLLPSRLPPGHYLFDVKATDSAGDHTKLSKGSSRIHFDVK